MKKKLEVGMKLFFVFSRYSTGRNHREVEVKSVGRKWAQLSNGNRISLDTWVADGGNYSSPGMCYESRQQYEEKCKVNTEWEWFRRLVNSHTSSPKEVTVEKIKQAVELLGLKGN